MQTIARVLLAAMVAAPFVLLGAFFLFGMVAAAWDERRWVLDTTAGVLGFLISGFFVGSLIVVANTERPGAFAFAMFVIPLTAVSGWLGWRHLVRYYADARTQRAAVGFMESILLGIATNETFRLVAVIVVELLLLSLFAALMAFFPPSPLGL